VAPLGRPPHLCYDTAAMAVTCGRCGWQGDGARYCPRCGAELGAPVAAPPPSFPPPAPPRAPAPGFAHVPAATRPAGFWVRAVAVLIDGVVLLIAQGILFGAGWMLWGGGMGGGILLKGVTQLFSTLLGAAYSIVFHWKWGQTLGKMALQIRVVGMDGGGISFGQSVGRYFGTMLSALIFCIGFVMAGVRSDKRALHDLLAGTRVEHI
jgi:uncharacterized RDD family membrane protein YckC